jgi:hypothetical protein
MADHSEVEAGKIDRCSQPVSPHPPEFERPPSGFRMTEFGKDFLALRGVRVLVVQNNVEQGAVHLQAAVIVDETELPEFIHEKIHTAARGAYQLS